MEGTVRFRVYVYVSVGEKEINHRYSIYGYVFIIDSKKLMQIWKVAFYRIEKYLKLAVFLGFSILIGDI